jgi:hypothetical protein
MYQIAVLWHKPLLDPAIATFHLLRVFDKRWTASFPSPKQKKLIGECVKSLGWYLHEVARVFRFSDVPQVSKPAAVCVCDRVFFIRSLKAQRHCRFAKNMPSVLQRRENI